MCGIFFYRGKRDLKLFKTSIESLKKRGPDNSNIIQKNDMIFGFHRLAITDLTSNGMQPLYLNDDLFIINNGEIYNYKELIQKYNFIMKTDSETEVILHMYYNFGIERTLKELNGEFAFIIYDKSNIIIARDHIGIRPLFYGCNAENEIFVASELKAIYFFVDNAKQFLPGYFMVNFKYTQYYNYKYEQINYENENIIQQTIYKSLDEAVKLRLIGERKIGAYLSGGLDSSIIVSLISKYIKQFDVFSVGIEDNLYTDDILHAAELVSFLNNQGCNITHHIVRFTINEAIKFIPKIIYALESYDTTTIRASIGQYILAKYIKKNTDIKILFSGEGADELGGYSYFKKAPNEQEFFNENIKLLKELHMFDVLRTDRTTSRHGLEVRVPFLDKNFL